MKSRQASAVVERARLLEHSDKHSMTAYAVIGLFCGLRREELERLQWDAVKLSERIIMVGADVAKLRRQRHVTITDTAALWLAGIVKKSGPVVDPENFRKRFDQWRKASGLRRWPNNALRRRCSAAFTLRRSRMKSAPLTRWATRRDMVHRHYKALLTEAAAAKYWSGQQVVERSATHCLPSLSGNRRLRSCNHRFSRISLE